MNVSYRLKRVCGSVYGNGNIVFTKDGNSVLSPVGNQVNVFNLVDQTAKTLNFESKKNIRRCVLSHNGIFLVAIDTEGHAMFINYHRQVILHRFHFKRKVYDIKFSPDDQYFAVTFGHSCQIWKTPCIRREFSPLSLKRVIGGHYDDTTCIDWSHDGSCLVMGSKDLTARVYIGVRSKRMALHVLSGHRDKVLGVYFADDTNELIYTVAQDGAIFTWKLDFNPLETQFQLQQEKKRKENYVPEIDDDNEDDEYGEGASDNSSFLQDDESSNPEDDDDDGDDGDNYAAQRLARDIKIEISKSNKSDSRRPKWMLDAKEFLWDQKCSLSSVTYQASSKLLVVGFDNGVFGLYEMPGCVSIQRLSISNSRITSANINPSGDWLVLGSSSLSQLLVWEWKSETYILKQQGHLYGMNSLDYSSDGMFLATGGDDSKVKIWSAVSGFCVVTFTEHIAPVTGVKFIGKGSGKALISCSLDGSVRAHDLMRYRNFRTLTTANPVQFTSVASDPSGEVVCAGSLDPFLIHVWSLQSGHLLEVLAGHEGPIATMDFSPTNGFMVSGSWDGTLKIWDVYKNECVETLEHGCDVLCAAFRPDGKEVCTCTTNGNITVWEVESGETVITIEGRRDLLSGRLTTDVRAAATSAESKYFKSVTYTPDGSCILGGGHSKYVCLYSASSGILIKKFELSHNRSLEGMNRFLRSDQIVDGISLENLNAGDNSDDEYGFGALKHDLPGSNKGRSGANDDGSRTTRPVIMTCAVKFSYSGREWAAATSQGLQVFGLADDLVFTPEDLSIDATPQAVISAIKESNYGLALRLALQLSTSESEVLQAAIEAVPVSSIELVVKSIHPNRFKELFKFLAQQILNSRYLEYYLHWSWQVLRLYGPTLQRDTGTSLSLQESLRGLMRSINLQEKEILRSCEQNLFLLDFISTQHNLFTSQQPALMNPHEFTEAIMNNEHTKSTSSLMEFKEIKEYLTNNGLNAAYTTELENFDKSVLVTSEDLPIQSGEKTAISTRDGFDTNEDWPSNWVDDEDDANIAVMEEGSEQATELEASAKSFVKPLVSGATGFRPRNSYTTIETLPDGTLVEVIDVAKGLRDAQILFSISLSDSPEVILVPDKRPRSDSQTSHILSKEIAAGY